MKCEVCLNLLEEYLDGELPAADQDEVGAHLITCGSCAASFASLSAEQEIFAHYDRDLEAPATLWSDVEERIAPVPETSFGWWTRIAALVLLSAGLASAYYFFRSPATAEIAALPLPQYKPDPVVVIVFPEARPRTRIKRISKPIMMDQSGVYSADLGYLDIDDRETAKHIEQTENFLRSIRNFPVSDSDDEIDVSYDKALSRRLLNENVVLRRDAEMKAKFPTKTLLADLEPFLIDIANLPDRAKPEEVRAIKERVQKTEIVAALLDYQDRGTNNR